MTETNNLEQNQINSEYEEDIDIEEEEEPTEEPTLSQGFDPTCISMGTNIMTVQQILNRLNNHRMIAPEFQRKEGIWTKTAKSRLIESLLVQIPLPAFYIDATNDDKWLVIDGMQRITTFKEFVTDQSFTLDGLDFFTDLHGKKYQELTPRWQRRIKETKLTVYLILRGTSSEITFNIFKRINQGGTALSAQEMRYAKNSPNKITNLLKELSQSPEFKKTTDNGIKDKRMIDQECILKVLSLMTSNIDNLNFKDYDYFLDGKMTEMNQMDDSEIENIKQEFLLIMNLAYDLFDRQAFRKPKLSTIKQQKRYPINKALLEAWSINLAKLDDQEINIVKQRKEDLYEVLLKEQEDGKFDCILYKSAGDANSVKERFKHIQGIIQSILL
ncbi:DUF262 domain-containing protein [Dolichospermum sp. ST_con]|nr:DUF262 domain-containing protein [Dolichospermum sp. ST_con]MDD1421189.1 DUF262 domain-containing protein [Dolichospermum sp. ST_sed1]MDD1426293.1 DUF262 domain-containing protein [Dolichospermum sp. ST_sed9]MDD1433290.1 DUF262 domain-containing protein [Dolichospermum sp. ST_sed6]MDD1436420.1 DUF262 domain-containing protein [Dolichospermum sp. ST_sed10]MDD1442172.1 DUF262 domain-containing protein [Dolichospermum sp. ST_sed3]MDD1444581.1 DUF262 domain-containing protein [Dolichospermum s